MTSSGLLVLTGLVAITLGQRVVARTEAVYEQIPALVSGGIAGMALVLLGCVFAFVQVSRHCAAQERAEDAEVLAEVVALTEVRRQLTASKAVARKGAARRTRATS